MYKHLIFDLDHTLWDFDRNASETLSLIFDKYDVGSRSQKSEKELFVKKYFHVNKQMWKLFDKNLIDKQGIRDLRFKKVLQMLNIRDQQLALQLETAFLQTCPARGHLIAGAKNILEYLVAKNYTLHILTNGFRETQQIKIVTSGIEPYFTTITTSDCSGHKKPKPEVFDFTLKKINAQPSVCLMIGDNLLTDIKGAKRSGIDQLFFNPHRMKHTEKPTYEVSCLDQIREIL